MNYHLTLAMFCPVLGMFQFGFHTGIFNEPESKIEHFLNETFRERYNVQLDESALFTYFSLAVSVFYIGGLIGSLSAGYLADRFGRKEGLLYAQIFPTLAALFMGSCQAASSYEMLLMGRIFAGLGAGLFTGLSPLYISEIAPISIRGAMVTVNQLAVASGIFISEILGLEAVLGTDELWPILLALTIVPSLFQCTMLPFIPETPRYLILSMGQIEEGREVLQKLRNTRDVEQEIESIQGEEAQSSEQCESTLSIGELLLSSKLRLSLFVCICLQLCPPFSGMVGLLSYSTHFFVDAGISSDISQYATLGVGATLVAVVLGIMQ